jgi:hypothetical protein
MLAVCVLLSAAACASSAVERGASTEIQLTYKAGAIASKAFTPAESKFGGKPFRINGEQGSLSLGGQSVLFGVKYASALKAFYGALDADGDGELKGKEWVKFSQTMSASYKIKLGEQDYAVRISNVRVSTRTTGGPVLGISGGYLINACYAGTFQNQSVLLFDDNLDGVFTQDGKDAIAVGRDPCAIPLGKIHQIGKVHYELEVAEDGKKVTFTPVTGLDLGIVEISFKRGMRCLAFIDDEGHSYDLAVSAKTGIPAGKYRMSYGILTAGKFATVVQPTDKTPVYEIQAGKINTIRLGKPIRVSFMASYSDQTVRVQPSVQVFGSGGELYSFDYSGGTGRPHVLLFEGKRVLSRSAMEYG